jgi:hypothetical protein
LTIYLYHFNSFKGGPRQTEAQQTEVSSFDDCEISPLTEASENISERKFGTTTSTSTVNKSHQTSDPYRAKTSGTFGKKKSDVRLVSVS